MGHPSKCIVSNDVWLSTDPSDKQEANSLIVQSVKHHTYLYVLGSVPLEAQSILLPPSGPVLASQPNTFLVSGQCLSLCVAYVETLVDETIH